MFDCLSVTVFDCLSVTLFGCLSVIVFDCLSDAADLSCAVLEAFPKTVIVCMLRAMKFGSSEAQQRFPRLLQLVESHPDTVADFRKQVITLDPTPCS